MAVNGRFEQDLGRSRLASIFRIGGRGKQDLQDTRVPAVSCKRQAVDRSGPAGIRTVASHGTEDLERPRASIGSSFTECVEDSISLVVGRVTCKCAQGVQSSGLPSQGGILECG